MSYNFNSPCWNCKKAKESKCKDSEKISKALIEIHQDTKTHKGAGEVILMCCKQDSDNK